MSLPPVPPRPTSAYGPQRQNSDKPPLPPLPPQLIHEAATAERGQVFAAPRPQRYGNPATDVSFDVIWVTFETDSAVDGTAAGVSVGSAILSNAKPATRFGVGEYRGWVWTGKEI